MGNDKIKVEIGIQTTMLAIREKLMEYFKGDCGERMVVHTNVRLRSVDERHQFHYQRDLNALVAKREMFIGDVPIMFLTKEPSKVIVYNNTLSRSPQLRQIKAGIEKFFADYLPVVEVEVTDGN